MDGFYLKLENLVFILHFFWSCSLSSSWYSSYFLFFVLLMKSHLQSYPCPLPIFMGLHFLCPPPVWIRMIGLWETSIGDFYLKIIVSSLVYSCIRKLLLGYRKLLLGNITAINCKRCPKDPKCYFLWKIDYPKAVTYCPGNRSFSRTVQILPAVTNDFLFLRSLQPFFAWEIPKEYFNQIVVCPKDESKDVFNRQTVLSLSISYF